MALARVTIDDRSFLTSYDGRSLSTTAVLRAKEERLRHVVTAGTHLDDDTMTATLIARAAPLAHLTEGGVEALAVADDNLRRSGVRCLSCPCRQHRHQQRKSEKSW